VAQREVEYIYPGAQVVHFEAAIAEHTLQLASVHLVQTGAAAVVTSTTYPTAQGVTAGAIAVQAVVLVVLVLQMARAAVEATQ